MSELLTPAMLWAGLLAVAQVVVRATPSVKDDRIVSKVGTLAEGLRNLLQLQRPGSMTDDQNR